MRDASGRLTWRELADEPDLSGCGEEALAAQVKAEWLLSWMGAHKASLPCIRSQLSGETPGVGQLGPSIR